MGCGCLAPVLLFGVVTAATGQAQFDLSTVTPTPAHIGPFDGSYAQCILKEMPGVQNDATAAQVYVACLRRYPEGANTDEKGRGSFMGYSSGPECAAKKGKDTPSRTAGSYIVAACYHLYEPPR